MMFIDSRLLLAHAVGQHLGTLNHRLRLIQAFEVKEAIGIIETMNL